MSVLAISLDLSLYKPSKIDYLIGVYINMQYFNEINARFDCETFIFGEEKWSCRKGKFILYCNILSLFYMQNSI